LSCIFDTYLEVRGVGFFEDSILTLKMRSLINVWLYVLSTWIAIYRESDEGQEDKRPIMGNIMIENPLKNQSKDVKYESKSLW
jgi:hypothetical protein